MPERTMRCMRSWRAEPVAHVLDAMAMIFARRIFDGVLVGVERHVEGPVADGVHAAAQAGIVALLHGVVQFILLDSDNAVVMLVIFVGIVEAGVAAGDTAVDAHLDAADSKPLVAETRDETEIDETALDSIIDSITRGKMLTRACILPFSVDLLVGAHRFAERTMS